MNVEFVLYTYIFILYNITSSALTLNFTDYRICVNNLNTEPEIWRALSDDLRPFQILQYLSKRGGAFI